MEYLTNEQRVAKQKSEMNARRLAQIEVANGEAKEEMFEANRKPGHKIRSSEADYVHVRTMEKHLNNDQKSFTEAIKIVKIHPREFDRRVKEGAFKTYDDVEVLHDPRGGIKIYDFKPEILSQEKNPLQADISGEKTRKDVAEKEKQIIEAARALDAKEQNLAEREKAFERKMLELQDLKDKLNNETAPGAPQDAAEKTESAPKGKK
jgi:hypothetical protein